jgi:CheY-like chemotaxis protein
MAKILHVEDNEMSNDMLSRHLKRRGFEYIRAFDGEQAIKLAYNEQPDLILMDMSLPVKYGWTTTKEIKAAKKTRNIPIIALTAHAMSGDREHALAVGCDEYDTKPIELPRLLEKINRLLSTD